MADVNVEILNETIAVNTGGAIRVQVEENTTSVEVNETTIAVTLSPTTIEVKTNEQGPAGPPGSPLGVWKGVYNNSTTYSLYDVVEYLGSSYVAIAETTGNLPTDVLFWELMVQKGEDGGNDKVKLNAGDTTTGYLIQKITELYDTGFKAFIIS